MNFSWIISSNRFQTNLLYTTSESSNVWIVPYSLYLAKKKAFIHAYAHTHRHLHWLQLIFMMLETYWQFSINKRPVLLSILERPGMPTQKIKFTQVEYFYVLEEPGKLFSKHSKLYAWSTTPYRLINFKQV